MKIVSLQWMDIAETKTAWQTIDELETFITNTKQNIVHQVGFLYEEDENQIVVLNSFFPNGELYGTCNVIPRGCIISMKELGEDNTTDRV